MPSKRRVSGTAPGGSDDGLFSSKRCRTQPFDDSIFGNQLDVQVGSVIAAQTPFGTTESAISGLATEASQPISRSSQAFPRLPEDWLDLDQLTDFFDPFEENECEQEQAPAKDVLEANPDSGCQLSKGRPLSTGSIGDATLHELMDEMVEMEIVEPPLSALRAMDRSSRSVEDFDPRLQHSPVSANSLEKHSTKEEKELDYEIDWNPVHRFSRQSVNNAFRIISDCDHQNQVQDSQAQSSSPSTLRSLNTRLANHAVSQLMLKPHRIFLRIGEMLEAKESMFRHSDDVVFELFARVLYSRRENFGHRQYFQFRDLFKESPPFLSGALMG